jgi:hypothetical protein
VVSSGARTVRSWPLLVLAAPAAAEVWSGWVGIAQKTGFGLVSPLPGIWPSLHLDTSITLPADFAERTWCKHRVDLGFHVEDMCVTSAVSLWYRQVGCERALDAVRRARARVSDLAIWRSCGGAP